MVLKQKDYDAAYFGDTIESGGLRHDAGYRYYLKLILQKPYQKRCDRFINAASGKILELGCGVGTYARKGRVQGLDWTAIDVSNWCKRHEVTTIIENDALTFLQAQTNNSFDWIVSWGFIECLKDSDLKTMKDEMNRVCINQKHFSYTNPNSQYYNIDVKSKITDVRDIIDRD